MDLLKIFSDVDYDSILRCALQDIKDNDCGDYEDNKEMVADLLKSYKADKKKAIKNALWMLDNALDCYMDNIGCEDYAETIELCFATELINKLLKML